MEMIVLSFFLGVIVVASPLLVWLAYKGEEAENRQITTDDMKIVLETLRMSASRYEREVIDAIIERLGGRK